VVTADGVLVVPWRLDHPPESPRSRSTGSRLWRIGTWKHSIL